MSFSWQSLPKPIIGLSPMDGITDFAFRQIHAHKGKPDICFTEFTHVEGMWHGKPYVLENFLYHQSQQPVVAQIYGSKPEYFYKAALMVCAMGFEAIDINMGCPAKNVTHSGGGAALIGTPDIAKNIVRSVKKAIEDWTNGITLEEVGIPQEKIEMIKKVHWFANQPKEFIHSKSEFISFEATSHRYSSEENNKFTFASRKSIPISIKTRIGIAEPQTEDWIKHLLEVKPANITLHGRTLKQMYTGLADWEELKKAATIVKQTETTFLANGDVISREDALQKIDQINSDGILIGRAAMGNPWIWKSEASEYSPVQRLTDALEHARLHAKMKEPQHFIQMRKHFSFYIKDFPYANEVKVKLIRTSTLAEAEEIIHEALEKNVQN